MDIAAGPDGRAVMWKAINAGLKEAGDFRAGLGGKVPIIWLEKAGGLDGGVVQQKPTQEEVESFKAGPGGDIFQRKAAKV